MPSFSLKGLFHRDVSTAPSVTTYQLIKSLYFIDYKLIFIQKCSMSRPRRPEYQNTLVQPSLPTSRPRDLTPPFAGTDTVKQWTDPQTATLLMHLPTELRLRIYEAVLGHRKVHLAFEFGAREYRTFKRKEALEWRWWHSICTWDQTDYEPWKNVFRDQCRWTRNIDGEPGPPNGQMGG